MADMEDYADLDDAPEEPIDDIPYSQVQSWCVSGIRLGNVNS